jgi:quinol monooxygenase YgiN
MLRDSPDSLGPAIRRLEGVIDYYAGIDRASSTMVNVSVWESEAHAKQMATLPEMQVLRAPFEEQEVAFEPIVNYDVLWRL